MRRLRFALIILIVVLALSASIIFFRLRYARRPTSFNWSANAITLAGNGAPAFNDDSQPMQAGFSDPFGIAIGHDGTIYISDAGDSNRIRKITSQGLLVTIAGGPEGAADGSQASFNTPSGLAVDDAENIYVADTGYNRIRKITPAGVVSTVAGSGAPGYADGPALSAQFNGPIGVSVDAKGVIYVADTYNDRIRKITPDGQVSTIAGGTGPGAADGDGASAQFDTPCGIVVSRDGSMIVADTGNNRLRKITLDGHVTTLSVTFVSDSARALRTPIGLALTHDGFLYVTELERATVVQIAPDGKARVVSGNGPGFADGANARFNQPTGLAVESGKGDLVIADSANYLVRKLSHLAPEGAQASTTELLPRLTPETLGQKSLLWPLDPQDRPHEIAATMGEVRGSFDSTDSRDHLHSGLDVFGGYGDAVRAIRSEKVTSPVPTWGFNSLSEGLRSGIVSYIHMQVGRDKDGKTFTDSRFIWVRDADNKLERVRVKRGTRFQTGDALGTVNRMYHVHLIVGPSGAEINPLSLSPVGFTDEIAPTIEKNGVQLFDESGRKFTEQQQDRLVVYGRVRVVVDAFDRTNMNAERRRLGLYRLGYQVFKAGSNSKLEPAAGFNAPRMTIEFNRLPWGQEGPKLAYAEQSGITVYGSKTTRFLYEVTNTVRDGRAVAGLWDTTELAKGDYVLRIVAADFSGNETQRDLFLRVK